MASVMFVIDEVRLKGIPPEFLKQNILVKDVRVLVRVSTQLKVEGHGIDPREIFDASGNFLS